MQSSGAPFGAVHTRDHTDASRGNIELRRKYASSVTEPVDIGTPADAANHHRGYCSFGERKYSNTIHRRRKLYPESMSAVSQIRILEGPVSDIIMSGPSWLTFKVGTPPEFVTVAGVGFTRLARDEYVAVAVKGRSFLGKGAAALAYRWLAQRGEPHGIGYSWIAACLLACVGGFLLSGLTLIRYSNPFVAAILATISAAFGVAGANRLRSVREAVRLLAACSPL